MLKLHVRKITICFLFFSFGLHNRKFDSILGLDLILLVPFVNPFSVGSELLLKQQTVLKSD